MLELLQGVCGTAAGFAWLEAASVPRLLCEEATRPLEDDVLGAMLHLPWLYSLWPYTLEDAATTRSRGCGHVQLRP